MALHSAIAESRRSVIHEHQGTIETESFQSSSESGLDLLPDAIYPLHRAGLQNNPPK